MKKTAAFFLAANISFAATVTITADNHPDLYVPDSVSIRLGDTVSFELFVSHDAVEGSKENYDANGNTPLPGGFNVDFGGGITVLKTLGTHYYFCTPHVNKVGAEMRGRIIVLSPSSVETATLAQAKLLDAVPNPARAGLRVKYTVPQKGLVSIYALDIQGRIVDVLFQGLRDAGHYELDLKSDRKAGTRFWFIKMTCGKTRAIKKILFE